jgi:hypothetical protein
MYCGGGHLGFPIDIKNINLVEDLPMIIPGQFGYAFFSETTNIIKAKPYMNVHWVILYKLHVFCSDMKFKMAATTGLSLTLDPKGKMCIKNIYFVEDLPMIILGQFGFNCPSDFREEAF